MSYIYKIINDINGKIYIGKTNETIEKRFQEHCRDYKRETEEKRPLYSAMNKYGIENFSIEKVEECSIDIVNEREKYWIEYYGSFKNGYNATLGGDGKAYIDRKLVIETYKRIQNCIKTAEICGVHISSVYQILEENNIKRKSAQQIAREQNGKSIIMLDLQNNIIKTFSTILDRSKIY